MYRKKVTISSVDEAESHLANLDKIVLKADLNQSDSDHLRSQLEASFSQFSQQLAVKRTNAFNARSEITGNGYKIIINVNSSPPTLFSKIIKMLGF